jgi:glycosyltransferase involved in cell wall biosynthesis
MSREGDFPAAGSLGTPPADPPRTPLVTIGMPVYNGARYLEEAIASLQAQTEDDFILHISDNCSDDATPEICTRLAAEDPRIRYERQERNLGAVGNFQYLLRAAGTPFFMWAAHDDLWDPDFVNEALGLLRRSPDAVGCAVGLQGLIPATGLRWQVAPPAGLSSLNPAIRARAAFQPGGWHAIYGLYRRDALEIEDPVLHDVNNGDGLFVFRMSLRGTFAVSNRTLQVFREVAPQAKAAGPEAHMYSGNFTAASRLMWRYAGEAELSRWQRASLRGYVLWKWFTFTRDWAARLNLERGSRAWREGRYPQVALILTKQLFLRPSDLLHQARRRLRARSGV